MSGAAPRPSLTDEQRHTISARGVSIALAAGAGCGKTTVLTERFVSLLEGDDRLPLSGIVALTFTEKAARELRDRVRVACRARMDRGDDPAYWRSVVRGLESARIGTFHAFCAEVLRRFAPEARCDPAFEVLDESVAPTIRRRALDASLRRWLADEDEDFRALAVEYGVSELRRALSAQLADRPAWDIAAWARRDPAEVLTLWERFRENSGLRSLVRAFAESQSGTAELLRRHACKHEKMRGRVARILQFLPTLHEAADPLAALSELREDAKVQGGGNKTHWDSEDIFESVKDRLTKMRKGIDDLNDLFGPDERRSFLAAECCVRFARLLRDAIDAYEKEKVRAGVLDFHDLQAKVLDLLRDDSRGVRDALRESIAAILVDEFQDTDSTQSEILELLAGDSLHSGRLFLVGDAKQSIYGFRGAEPAIFGTFRERFPDAGRRDLTRNFRSVPGILHFVNALFADTFEGAEHRLRPGREDGGVDSGPPAVEFLLPASEGPVAKSRKAEAEAIARLLAQRLEQGWTLCDRGSGRPRKATQGDVAILFRSRAGFPAFEAALAGAGLDYHVVGGSAYFAQQEVIDLANLLSAVEDPMDPLALAGVLRGPFFGVSDEGLYWLATAGKGDLVATFEAWPNGAPPLAEDDRAAVQRASDTLRLWRSWKDRMPIAEWLGRVLDESGFEAALMGEFLGDRKRANVRKLVEMARAFDARGGLSLGDFVEKLRDDIDTPPREDQAATADEGGEAVRLMTIHQAKGLEFPIVVLPDLDRGAPNETDLVTRHPDLGFLLRPPKADGDEGEARNLARSLASELKKRAEDEEALRVFYVATTRARDALILSPGPKAGEPNASPAARLLAERFDLVSGACLASLPEGFATPRVGAIDPATLEAPSGLVASRFRPKILLASRAITGAPAPGTFAEEAPEPPPPASRSLIPGAGLSATASQVDRLMRAVVRDPGSWGRERPDAVIEHAAKRIGMLAPARVRNRVVSLLEGWRESHLARELSAAEELRSDLPWSLAWPPDDDRATVYSGRIDLAFRNGDGQWTLMAMASEGGESERDRLLLGIRLATRAADALGLGRAVRALLVVLREGTEGPMVEFVEVEAVSPTER